MVFIQLSVDLNRGYYQKGTDKEQLFQARDHLRHVRDVHAARHGQYSATVVPGHASEASGRAVVHVENDLRRRQRKQQLRVHRPEQPVRRSPDRREQQVAV